MQFIKVSPFSLQPNPWNSNKVNRPNFEKLKTSLTTHGAFKAITARKLEDGSLEILGGYHRNEAAKELGWLEVPVLVLSDINDTQAKEISLIDNTRYGQDDEELLGRILAEIGDLSSLEASTPEELLPDLDSPDMLADSLTDALAAEKELDGESDTHKTLKFKLEIDKAEEIEAILSKVAYDHDYKHRDGYSNFGEALYHVLILEDR